VVMLPASMSIVVLYVVDDDVDVVDCSILTAVFAAEQRIAQEEEPSELDRGEEAACSSSNRLLGETSSYSLIVNCC
jgi:hypothetical protein